MGRIRSIHPGLYTDERYMAVSIAARELLKGIWTESDDFGIFEWKPLTLKARILPVDNVSVDELMAELEREAWVQRFEADGRSFGACRNFCVYQRPERPAGKYPLPEGVKEYVGIAADGTRRRSAILADDAVTQQRGNTDTTPRKQRGNTEKSASKGGSSVTQQRGISDASVLEQRHNTDTTPQLDSDSVSQQSLLVVEGVNSCADGMVSSVSIDTAAGAASVDLKKQVFDLGVVFLAERARKSDKAARALVGKWVGQHGEAAVLDALMGAQRQSPVETVAWIEGALKARVARSPGVAPRLEVVPRASWEKFASYSAWEDHIQIWKVFPQNWDHQRLGAAPDLPDFRGPPDLAVKPKGDAA